MLGGGHGTVVRWAPVRLLLVALCAIAVSPLSAAEPVDGPNAKFADPYLENMIGDWDLTRSVRGETVQNRVHVEWVLNHQFLQIHMTDAAMPPGYEALVLIGYSHADSEYVIHWCDVWGGKYSSMGKGKRRGDDLEFVFSDPDGSFYNTFTWEPKERGWTFRMESSDKSGARKPFATDVLRRK
jgi:hypothetical protein